MGFALKKISPAAIEAALAKADQYRLLNEPSLAESICRDVLVIDATNEAALVTLLLSLTDQFDAQSNIGTREAEALVPMLRDVYDSAYYAGIIAERWARALLRVGDAAGQAYDWLLNAMEHYEAAQKIGRANNDDPILRWNTCVRLMESRGLKPPVHAEHTHD